MHRSSLISLLEKYTPADENEKAMLKEMVAFVKKHEDCFERSLSIGHVTASAMVVNSDRTHVLLMHHKKLNKWFQPGGHCDGETDTLAVARKEAEEETGVATINADPVLFDVDIHLIPAHKDIDAHFHYDVRYLLVADPTTKIEGNDESNAVEWIPLERVGAYNDSESIMRMVRKI